jgi:hypothetical protein
MATLTTEQSERRSPGSSEVGLPLVGSPPNVDPLTNAKNQSASSPGSIPNQTLPPPAKPKLKVSEQSRSEDATNMPLWYIHEVHIKVRQQMVSASIAPTVLLLSLRRTVSQPQSTTHISTVVLRFLLQGHTHQYSLNVATAT